MYSYDFLGNMVVLTYLGVGVVKYIYYEEGWITDRYNYDVYGSEWVFLTFGMFYCYMYTEHD